MKIISLFQKNNKRGLKIQLTTVDIFVVRIRNSTTNHTYFMININNGFHQLKKYHMLTDIIQNIKTADFILLLQYIM